MQTLVLYTSNTGSAKRYAEDIASSLGADVMPLKKFKWKNIDDYGLIIYGGWIQGGKIKGVSDFLAHYDDLESKNVIIFSSGMVVPSKEGRAVIIDANILDIYHVRYYQLRGSFDINKLNFLQRAMIRMYFRQIEEDPNANIGYKNLLQFLDEPLDYYDREGVDKILSVAHKILAEEPEK